ncbi:hypothetical protein PMIN03_007524 [Paraphaeosphaeria minitans]|uniref:Uncharacterized protein n=1 Tax=Paraphaeosphaeria minitans TaxID=565426 RepID=A0A9P6GPZ6_9PLEO|nr:hypothetical protein PMIN01_01624 [Paraphaeosphaeria minitans]
MMEFCELDEASYRVPVPSQNRKLVDGDTDDLLFHTARRLELDGSLFSETWDAMPEEQQPSNPVMRAWMATFHASTGIERPEGEDVKDAEGGMWAVE